MNPTTPIERDELQRLLGARNERILQLHRQIALQQEDWANDAMEWRKLKIHRRELAEWIVGNTTNELGALERHQIDAGLGGEAFVPCSFGFTANERRYRLTLVSTQYEIEEIDSD